MACVTGSNGMSLPLITCYYWQRGFVLSAPSFMLDRQQKPYRRLAATLMHASRGPILLETGEGEITEARTVLIAPKTLRRRILALNSDITIVDLSVATPAFAALSPLLSGESVRVLDGTPLTPLLERLAGLRRGELPAEQLPALIEEMVLRLSGRSVLPAAAHPRIAQVLAEIERLPLHAVSLSVLAEQVHMSPSRLRHLFSEQMGCSLTHYLRWAAVWKGVWLWSRGRPLAEIVEEVGFHDLAHLNRAFNEVFGLNPSMLFDPGQVGLHRCDWV